ncbi:DNA ligase D [Arenibacter sp. BSSL-BM3]|uniref:DNA ligase (ATP) n=1 Tax=Arenibacter arenosicollis TaxID=2762274 RepID=A0ABR7QSC0_9FLAO|nr:DNA ligase D [Arenibacter arenosicollis]
MDLSEYNRKRNFAKTPEPEGGIDSSSRLQRFVIQRHVARKLHYDLRLQIDGTLKSWAVPKGPSMNPSDKRLAVRTEDHPIEYLNFHGVIPKGNYGAGEMIIWDSGVFDIDETDKTSEIHQQLLDGNLKLIFHGQKIKGRFALVRTGKDGEKENWLLMKKKDKFSTSLFYDAESLIDPGHKHFKENPLKITPGKILQPMLAESQKEIFNDPEWIFELKWDGYRILTHISENGVFLQSRNGIKMNDKFPELVKELENVEHQTILDGELTVIDENGVSQFGELQNYPDTRCNLRYYVFDMLYLNGHSMLNLNILDRKSLIPELIEGMGITQYCDHIEGMGVSLFNKATEEGMEGIMAKWINSNYSPGTRSNKWLKIKSIQSENVLICGYTDSVGGGVVFGSLILGKWEGDELEYIGNCGTGFTDAYREELLSLFEEYRTSRNPFGRKLPLKGRNPNWMVPTLECEVTYSERTKNGLLRHPVFKRMLNDPKVPEKKIKDQTNYQRASTSSSKEIVEIDGLAVSISNLEKVYWPESGYTKYDLIDYYLQISGTILPYLKDRPQSLHRYPNGILEESFYQKDNDVVPEWMQTITIPTKSSKREIRYLLCQNPASLIYMANLGCIEMHPWNSRIGFLDKPDYGVLDLDPPKGREFRDVAHVALIIHDILTEANLKAYCKTSGAKGLHVYFPMGGKYTYEEVRNFIKLICYYVEQRLPTITTMERRLNKRDGKIYLDYLQNRKGQTVASPYSVRPVKDAQVSTPLQWDELKNGATPNDFMIKNLSGRLAQKGDLFLPVLKTSFNMEKSLEKLDKVQN